MFLASFCLPLDFPVSLSLLYSVVAIDGCSLSNPRRVLGATMGLPFAAARSGSVAVAGAGVDGTAAAAEAGTADHVEEVAVPGIAVDNRRAVLLFVDRCFVQEAVGIAAAAAAAVAEVNLVRTVADLRDHSAIGSAEVHVRAVQVVLLVEEDMPGPFWVAAAEAVRIAVMGCIVQAAADRKEGGNVRTWSSLHLLWPDRRSFQREIRHCCGLVPKVL